MLESALRGTPQARYSILFAFPGESLRLDTPGEGDDFLRELDVRWARERVPLSSGQLPFRGGWFLFLDYELARQVGPVLSLPRDPCGLPAAFAQRFPCAVVVDHLEGRTYLIVSNVTGTLRADVTPGEVIRAVFPGGTITGCPKVRCMEIIAELEGEGRGAYTGSLGYLNRDGDMDLNILIRTLVQRGREIHFRTGAGIVADSDPQRELEETRHKAEGLRRALLS